MTLPLIAPAVLASLLLCFAISIDDFVVTYFNAGSEVTFPLFVWGAARIGAPAQVNVIGTAIFVVALAAMLFGVLIQKPAREERMTSVRRRFLRKSFSRPPRTTCGCTSPAWAAIATASARDRARRGLLPRTTRTASATSTRSPGCSRSTSATRTATRSARRRSSRCASCPSTRTGRTRIRARSSSAEEVASLAPGDLNRVFFVSGGSEAVESAWKLARQYYAARGEKSLRGLVAPGARAGAQEPEVDHDAIVAAAGARPRRYKAIARHIAYHGTTFGALSINGIPAIRTPFEPLVPEVRHVSNTNRYHRPPEETEEEFTRFLLDELEQTILAMGPETVCLVHMEPVQNAGGCFTPPEGYWRGVRRDLRPLRHPALGRRGDHRLRAARSLVRLGALRHPAGHRHVREGALVVVRRDRRGGRDRPRDGAVPRRDVDVLARDHVRRPPVCGDR